MRSRRLHGFVLAVVLGIAGPEALPRALAGSRWADSTLSTQAAAVRRDSRAAFLRGLLPLADYLEHLAAAEEADLTSLALAVQSGRLPQEKLPEAIREALQSRRQALAEASAALTRFRQPAATGWAGDVALARYALVKAERQSAPFDSGRDRTPELTAAEAALAIEHYRRRTFEAHVLGYASLPQMAEAAAMLNIAPPIRQELAQSAANVTERWSASGAGIGRRDLVLRAQIDRATVQLPEPYGYSPRLGASETFLNVDRLAGDLFQQTQQYREHGTAALDDLSRAWRLRQHLHHQAWESFVALPAESRQALQRDLTKLQQIAATTNDRRGRVAGDVAYVELLARYEQATQHLQAESLARAANRNADRMPNSAVDADY